MALSEEWRVMPINRRHLLGSAASLCLADAGQAVAADEPKQIREDYALARQRFRTHLLKRGPAPDPAQPLEAPPGARQVGYRSGSLDLVAWISEDAGSGDSRPGLLFLHGGNALWQGHWDLARPYVEAGYVAMMPAVRGENGLPGDFSGFYDETADVLAAAAVLSAQPSVDLARLYLAGHSVGGTLTMLAAMSTPLFRAAAAFSGNPDARAFFRRFPEDVRFDTADPAEFDMRSAACFAESFKCPMLLLHGNGEHGADAAVRLTTERAKAAGLSVERAVVEGDHMSAIPGEIAQSLRFFASV
jgi:dipeptidyl aminopeptidase/acylaminoacyl peptidase